MFRLCRPALLVGAGGALASLYVCQIVAPAARHQFREASFSVLVTLTEADIRPGEFFQVVPGRVMYARRVSPAGWRDVLLFDAKAEGEPRLYLADRGRLVIDQENTRAALVLQDVVAHPGKPGTTTYRVDRSRQVTLDLGWETVAPRISLTRTQAELSVQELRAGIEVRARDGLPTAAWSLALHERYAIPATCLAIALLGVALGATTRRSSKLGSFVLGLAVIFSGYVVMFCCRSLVVSGYLPPVWGAWIPNGLLGVAGVALLIRRSRWGEPSPLSTRIKEAGGAALRSLVAALRGAATARAGRSFSAGRILDRYVARLYGVVFLLSAAGLLVIFYITMFTDLSADLFAERATLPMLLLYQWYATPQTLCYVIPIAAQIAALATIGLLTMSSELVVMKACGISLYRIALPIVLAAGLCSGALFGMQESVLGRANRLADAQRRRIHGEPAERQRLDPNWIAGRSGAISHYADFSAASAGLRDVTTLEFDTTTWRLKRKTFAARAEYVGRGQEAPVWLGHQVTEWNFRPDGQLGGYTTFEQRELSLDPPERFGGQRIDATQLTYVELTRYVRDLRARGLDATPDLVSLRRKLSFPLVPLVMTLIAVPFAATVGRRGALFGIAAGVGLAFGYWMAASVLAAIGRAGALDPTLAAWAPNLAFSALAAYLLLTTRT